MSEITSIEPQAKNKNRCNVYVDGKFYCGIMLETAVKYRLKAGLEVDKSYLDKIQLEAERSKALDKALSYISARMKTVRQISDYLNSKGYTPAVINYVTGKLSDMGLADDYAYCKAYAESVTSKGKRALEAELLKRGADKKAIERTLEETEENAGQACAILEKYLRGKPCDRQNMYKGFKYLLSRGYSAETAEEALNMFGRSDEDN